MPVDKELLISEKKLISLRLNKAINDFYEAPSENSLITVFDELVFAVIYNLNLHIPIETSNGEITYAFKKLANIGYVYQAFTTSEEMSKCPIESSAVISIRKLFERVANDSIAGLALNPGQNIAIVFLNRENIKGILRIASTSIEAQPKDVRDFLQNEI